MNRHPKGLCPAAALACALLLAAPAAHADKPRRVAAQPPLAQSLQGDAREAYRSAELLFNNGDFSGAEAKYQQAYDLSKDPRLLFDTAIAEKSLHAYARMQKHLEQYLREGATTVTQDDKTAVDAALAAIRNLVGSLALDVTPPAATVTVDGQPAGTAPLSDPIVLDLGSHTIVVQKTDFETATRTVNVPGGTSSSLSVALVKKVHTAHLMVVSEPGSTIVVDGELPANERFDGVVAAGTYDVRVTAPGRLPYDASVDLHEGETRTLDVSLRGESHGAVWPWVVGGAVVAAGAAVGGYFLFKPHDQTTPVPDGTFGPPIRLSVAR